MSALSHAEAGLFAPPAIDPDPNAQSLFGFIRAMVANPVSALPPEVYSEPVTFSRKTGKPVAFICDPQIIDEILIKRSQDFEKSLVDERVLRPAFGDSLLVAKGDGWRWKRRLAAPYFSPAALAKLVPGMVQPFASLADRLAARNDGMPVDIASAMTGTTLEVITATLFTSGEELDMVAVSDAIVDYLTPITWTISLASFRLPAWLPHPEKGKIRSGRKRMRELVGEVIRRRRQSDCRQQDICADLMRARDPETKGQLSDTDLIDMLLTLVVAGHETSANALTWALYCLAMQPRLQAELRTEVEQVAGGGPVKAVDLPKLHKMEAFLKESMRLFPPAPIIARRAKKAEIVGGYAFDRGMTLFIPIYALHRHEKLWASPKLFDPSRFSGESADRISRTAYMPFGAGPRICIGGTFAMMEMVAGLATLVQRLTFAPVAETVCDPVSRVTLRPRGAVSMDVGPVSG